MDLQYVKRNRENVLTKFTDICELEQPQLFMPLYKKFFSLNENNYNSISLNHEFFIDTITKKISENTYE